MTDLNRTLQTLHKRITEMPTRMAVTHHGAYIRLVRLFQTIIVQLTQSQRDEARRGLKRAMLSDEIWRLRVLRELGGEAIMKRWDRRFAKAQVLAREPYIHQDPAGDAAPQHAKFTGFGGRSVHPGVFYDRVKVDQAGQFCLAPVKGWRRHKPRPKTTPYENPNGLKVKFTEIDPIAITPAELREGILAPDADHANAMRELFETVARANALADKMKLEIAQTVKIPLAAHDYADNWHPD